MTLEISSSSILLILWFYLLSIGHHSVSKQIFHIPFTINIIFVFWIKEKLGPIKNSAISIHILDKVCRNACRAGYWDIRFLEGCVELILGYICSWKLDQSWKNFMESQQLDHNYKTSFQVWTGKENSLESTKFLSNVQNLNTPEYFKTSVISANQLPYFLKKPK